MVGSAIVRELKAQGYSQVITANRKALDLTDRKSVAKFLREFQPDCVVIAAARVGGIQANNDYPADFIFDNLTIEGNLIHGAFEAGCRNLLFLGSSCVYPKFAKQPIPEEALLTGSLEPTNEPYAIAKIAGIKLCESYNRQHDCDYRSVMPTNLYGQNDNFHAVDSHVVPALIRKFREAKEQRRSDVVIWGTGHPRREFLHVDDLASACIHVMELSKEDIMQETEPMRSHINIGMGADVTIHELAELIRDVVGFEGALKFDESYPDGTSQKLLDVSRINRLGWKAKIELREGLERTYGWFVENYERIRR